MNTLFLYITLGLKRIFSCIDTFFADRVKKAFGFWVPRGKQKPVVWYFHLKLP